MSDAREAMLRRAVEISLFTWRRADSGDPIDDDERMGWWGDSFPDVAGDRIGSRLWQLRRQVLTAEALRRAEEYCHEALQWMIDDEIVTAIRVSVKRATGVGRAAIERAAAEIVLSDNRDGPLTLNYDDMWRILDDFSVADAT
ncbi:phage GP46 family protein [Burkholderia metallica]|uniref:Phage GP46 family protein n=1 Tax=Burkholderia metallica TaxID=488729 RepID=A0ABT8PEZ3_9BURK|nr:phage GP46 family protein [Burkholderia metallica]MDN7933673.1 phage GP46 family protein [Burkholderia metallica]